MTRPRIRLFLALSLITAMVPLLGAPAAGLAAGDVVINEIIQNPAAVSDSNGEWFEVFNTTGSAIDIDGWTMHDNGTNSHVINNAGPLLVPAGGYLVLGINGNGATNGGVTVDYVYASFFLANGDDEVVLLDTSLTEIDRVEWDGGPVFPDPNGASMSLIDPALDNNAGANWCTAVTPFGDGDLGTPGAANDCGAEPPAALVFIHDVQGSGPTVAISGAVKVDAIVTALLEDDDVLDGFMLQEEDADADADLATSEGIRVFCGANCPAGLAVGDNATVEGNAGEFFRMSEINASGGTITINFSGNPLPTPSTVLLPAPEGTDEELTFEPLEGMLVTFTQKLVASEYFALARFGQVVLTVDQRPFQFTHSNAPSVAGYAAFLDDLATRRIALDDDNNDQNDAISGPAADEPYFYPQTGGFSTTNRFRGGDSVTGLTGALDWAFGEWRVKPITGNTYAFAPDNPRPGSPNAVGGRLKVASFNVLNFFTTIDTGAPVCGPSGTLGCRGADSTVELDRQRAKIVSALASMDADVVGIIEVQNDASASLTDLVGGLNAAVGPGTYDYVDTGTIGTDAIKVGLIYKPATVAPVGDFEILDSTVDPSFNDDKNRPVLIQTFDETATGARFTAAVNHLKSKGSLCDDVGDPNANDGQGNCNQTRTDAATALANYLATDPTGSGDPDFLIIGDLNAYAMEDPISALQGAGYTDLINTFGGSSSYSFVFDGQLGYLDHGLANASLLSQVTGATEWHINADEVNVLDYNDGIQDPGEASFERKSTALTIFETNAFRSSDHDPVLIGLSLRTAREIKEATFAELEALLPTGSSNNDKRIEKAIDRLDDSLNPDYWVSDSVVDDQDGKHVFDREQQAVRELMKVEPPDDDDVAEAIDSIVEADRQLAFAAFHAAVAGDGDASRIAKSTAELDLAAAAVAAGDFDKAVSHYKKAWQEAIKAR